MKVKCISNHNFNHNLFRGLEIGLIYDVENTIYMSSHTVGICKLPAIPVKNYLINGYYYPWYLFITLRDANLDILLDK